jgi:hypothetical protein
MKQLQVCNTLHTVKCGNTVELSLLYQAICDYTVYWKWMNAYYGKHETK